MAKGIDVEGLREFLQTNACGKQNAKIGMQLRELFGGSGACMRKAINELRRQGKPIGSSRDGYYWASTKEEIEKTVHHLEGRVNGILSAIEGLQKAKGQL